MFLNYDKLYILPLQFVSLDYFFKLLIFFRASQAYDFVRPLVESCDILFDRTTVSFFPVLLNHSKLYFLPLKNS